jgi:hypothetical protein
MNEEVADATERGGDFLDDTVGKIFLLRVAAHIVERQHRDRWLVGQRQRDRRFKRGGPPRLGQDPKRADRLSDVLELLLAEIGKGDGDFVADMIARRPGDTDCAGLGQRLQPGGNIDPVA